jgi:hypothetical protein
MIKLAGNTFSVITCSITNLSFANCGDLRKDLVAIARVPRLMLEFLLKVYLISASIPLKTAYRLKEVVLLKNNPVKASANTQQAIHTPCLST